MPYFYVVNQPNSKIGTSFIFFNMRLLIELFLYLRAVIIWTWICMEYHNSSYSTWLMVNYCRGYRSGLYTVCLEVYLVTHRVEIWQKPCFPGAYFGFFQCMNWMFPNLIHRFCKFPKMKVPSIKALQLIQLGQNNILNTTNYLIVQLNYFICYRQN